MSNLPFGNVNSIDSAGELNAFKGQLIRIHGFAQGEDIEAELLETGFDHIRVRITEGKFKDVKIQIDLHIKGGANPKIQYISCDGQDIYLHQGDVGVTEEFSIEIEVGVATRQIVRVYEAGLYDLDKVYREFQELGIQSPEVIRIATSNKTLAASLIGLNQDNAL